MTKEIAALPDKELDLDLNFEIRQQNKRKLYKMKIKAWDIELPCTVSFRLVKIKLQDKWLVLATNLPRKEFSARTLKNLYDKRWKIELAFRDIKHALGALHFHSKKDLFNLQEFFAHIIRYNLTSRIIRQIHLAKAKNWKYSYEINFKSAAQVVQEHCRNMDFNYRKILEQISKYVHPVRGNRLYRRDCRYIYPVSFNYRVA